MCINPATLKLEADEIAYCDSDDEKWGKERDVWTFSDGTEIVTINPHEFYNVDRARFMYIGDFRMGEHVRKFDGTTAELTGHETIQERTRHFTLFTKRHNNYFANGILTGNRYSTRIDFGGAK